ncbi:MAG: RrF2 family transcriptional regulator [Phycisphaerae bacterium]
MLSRTSQYALRAMIYLAQHAGDHPIPGPKIAREAQVPSKYLSKVLGDLVRAGVLTSSPGKTGGFRLVQLARATSLLDVVSPFEQFSNRPCPFGNIECSDRNPCVAHDRWKRAVEGVQGFLRRTSVQEVSARAVRSGKKVRSPRGSR